METDTVNKDLSLLGMNNCIRCGFCLHSCPSWLTHDRNEYYSPRARAILIQRLFNENLDVEEVIDSAKSIYTCNTCKRCFLECPTGVNVAELIIYAREYVINRLSK